MCKAHFELALFLLADSDFIKCLILLNLSAGKIKRIIKWIINF